MADEFGAIELELHGNTGTSLVPTVDSFVAGCTSGISSIIVGQPFDTIKIRLQTSKFNGPMQCLKQLVAREGPQALFKGMSSPILSATLVNAVVFSSYNEAMMLIRGASTEQAPTYSQILWAGAFAGTVQCSILCPAELVKCRLQVQTERRSRSYPTGPLTCIKSIYRSSGLAGFYQGLGPLLARDAPAFASYFSLYEIVKDQLEGRGNPLWLSSCVAGGCAGILSWTVAYPMDVIKSVVQTRSPTSSTYGLGMLGTARHLIQTQGCRVLFRGLNVAILRAVPVNCLVFPVYEGTVRALAQLRRERLLRKARRRSQEMQAPTTSLDTGRSSLSVFEGA